MEVRQLLLELLILLHHCLITLQTLLLIGGEHLLQLQMQSDIFALCQQNHSYCYLRNNIFMGDNTHTLARPLTHLYETAVKGFQ